MDELNTERALALIPEAREVNLLPAPVKHLKEVAALMATSGPLVGPAFQGRPERCFAIAYQAAWWSRHGTDFDPFAVSQKAYVTVDRRTDPPTERINYEAQLVNALINANAPIQEPLKVRYEGEGPTRRCIILGLLKGSDEWKEYRSPTFAQIKVKNSPLWFSDPDSQLFYYSSRMWARRWSPQTLMGVYSADEMPDYSVPDTRAAESLYADDAEETTEDAQFEDAGQQSAETAAEPGEEASTAESDLPAALQNVSEPAGSEEDRAWLAQKKSQIMENAGLGLPDGADIWAEALFTSKRFRRVIAYQQPLANIVRASVEEHLERLKIAKEAGADPDTGELFDK